MHAKKLVWILVICVAAIAVNVMWRMLSAQKSSDIGTDAVVVESHPAVKTPTTAVIPRVTTTTLPIVTSPQTKPDQVPAVLPPPVEPVPIENKNEIAAAVQRFCDASIPIETRTAEVRDLGTRADAKSIKILEALGKTDTYLNYIAIEALGRVRSAEVTAYLTERLAENNPRILAYAARSLGKVSGEEAIPAIAKTLAGNRKREDGYQDVVCAACVEALGDTRSVNAIQPLGAEFEETVGKTLHHDYGSKVVEALKTINNAACIPPLRNYEKKLKEQRAGMTDNVMGQKYIDGKITEVNQAIAVISGEVKGK